jgi:hypothetical protein
MIPTRGILRRNGFGVGAPVRGLIAVLIGALVAGALATASPSLAQAESLEISHGSEPTQDIALSVAVSGVADGHHKLYVFVNSFGGACSSAPDFDTGTKLANGTSLDAGSFSETTYSFTPPQPGTYTICAYLDEQEYDTPDVTTTVSFIAVMPSASVAVETSGKLTQEVPMSISISGTTEVVRKLYVFVNSFGGACSTAPDFDTGARLANGETLSAGSYSKQYFFTPAQSGTYTVCAYVDEAEYATPNATGNGSFTAGMPAGSVAVAITPGSSENGPVNIKLTGSTEVPRKLWVFVNSYGGACSSAPDFDTGTRLAAGEALSAGAYSKEYSFTPSQTTTYTVCGYLDEAEYAVPDATGSGSFTNTTPQSRAEAAKRVEEQATSHAAQEAAQAAEARKLAEYLHGVAERGHCDELSSEYSSSVGACKADEAAIRAAEEAKDAKEAAEWKAVEAIDLAEPVGSLSVKAITHAGTSSQHPGRTAIRIVTSPFAHVVIKIRRYGHRTERYDASPPSLTGRTGTVEVEYPWTCSRPGGSYRYLVTSRSGVGRTLSRSGHFSPVSVARCHALERREQEARERNARRYAEGLRQEREAEEARQREGEQNCRTEGGTVVHLYVEGEPRLGCRSPSGGLLPWTP